MRKMNFSIVLPTYNGAKFIEQALLSVLHQTFQPDEIIISDDNSADETLNICSKYAERVKIFRNSTGPSGFVQGWNNAIAHASGNYIAILHQDDLLAPTFLENIEKALELYPDVKHLFVPCNYIDANGRILREPDYCTGEIKKYTGRSYIDAYRYIGSPHIHRCPGVVTHRDIFTVCKYRSEAGHIADDDFFYRVGQYTDVVGILKPLAFYREHNKSETGHLKDAQLVMRLIHDMDFQIKHLDENRLFNGIDRDFFLSQKYKYIRRLIGYAIKYKNTYYLRMALNFVF